MACLIHVFFIKLWEAYGAVEKRVTLRRLRRVSRYGLITLLSLVKGRKLTLAFALLSFFLIIDSVFLYQNIIDLTNNFSSINRSYEISRELSALEAMIERAAADPERGVEVLPHIKAAMERIDRTLADDPSRRDRFGSFEAAMGRFMVDVSSKSATNFFITTEERKMALARSRQEVKAELRAVQAAEKNAFNEIAGRFERKYDWVFFVLGIAMLVNFTVLPLLYYFLVRNLKTSREREGRKDEFIIMASHELKTPVTSMKLYAQLLKDKHFENGDGESALYAHKIDEQADKLAHLISDMLDLSKIEAGRNLELDWGWFNINSMIRDIALTIQSTLKNQRVFVSGTIKNEVYADKDRISQVVSNLLSNAAKYSPNAKRIDVRLYEDGHYTVIEVEDYGSGIAEKDIPRIFDRFFRVNPAGSLPGLGIGLYISSEIIKRHGGSIAVSSKTGEGSTFTVRIPSREGNKG